MCTRKHTHTHSRQNTHTHIHTRARARAHTHTHTHTWSRAGRRGPARSRRARRGRRAAAPPPRRRPPPPPGAPPALPVTGRGGHGAVTGAVTGRSRGGFKFSHHAVLHWLRNGHEDEEVTARSRAGHRNFPLLRRWIRRERDLGGKADCPSLCLSAQQWAEQQQQ